MKVVFITPLRGGIGHWSRCLIEELDKFVDLIIVTFKRKRKEDDSNPFTRVTDPFILEVIDPKKVHHIIEYNNKKSLKELIEFTREVKPNCVHFVMWAGKQILWFLKDYSKAMKENSIPIVLTLHDPYPHIIQKDDVKIFTEAYAYATHIVVLTEDALKELRKNGVKVPITVIPHGHYNMMNKNKVDKTEARKIISKKLSIKIPENIPIILFFGFIRDYKGLEYLIRAAPLVLKKHNALFIAAGSLELAENPEKYSKEIKNLGLEEKFILFPHFVKD
ncbi:MAG TPA: glycosyltransferase, partial [Candidatus Aenigmarchaeota archaeon]|nr:glycosyltransferase [Candidatus Aenigmarchaeota archaeon]